MARILLNKLAQVSIILLPSLLLAVAASAQSQIIIKGGCELGMSQAFHGLPPEQAIDRIKQYANLYTRDYSGFKGRERTVRSRGNKFMLDDSWTQDTVVDFTRDQRELLYISIGGELALGRIDVDELPGYVQAIDQKVYEIEVQLGCTQPAAAN